MNSITENLNNGEIHYGFIPTEEILPEEIRKQIESARLPDNIVFHSEYAKNILTQYLKKESGKTKILNISLEKKVKPRFAIFYTGEKKPEELSVAFEELKLRFSSIGIDLEPADVDYVQGNVQSAEGVDEYLSRSDLSAKDDVLLATVGTSGCIIVYSDECLKSIGMSKNGFAGWISGFKKRINGLIKK